MYQAGDDLLVDTFSKHITKEDLLLAVEMRPGDEFKAQFQAWLEARDLDTVLAAPNTNDGWLVYKKLGVSYKGN